MEQQDKHNHRTYDAKDMYGQMQVDWQVRIDYPGLVKKRMERARQKMKENGLGAFLFFRHEFIRYLVGTWAGMVNTGEKLFRYCVLAGDEDPVMFEIPGNDLICQSCDGNWMADFRPAQIWRSAGGASESMATKFAKGVKDVLVKAGVADMPVGVDNLDYYGFHALEEQGIKVTDGLYALQKASQIKFPEEIEIIKQACAIQDAAFHAAHEAIRPGLKECELKGIIVNTLYSLGGERVEQITMGTGGRTNPFWRNSASDKMIRSGDMILIDICYQYNGYNTCYYRNFVCGRKATPEQKRLHKRTHDSLYAAINRIKPGVTTADVAKAWEGLEEDDRDHGSVSLMQFSHGVGITNHELPFTSLAYSKDYPETIEQNMVLAVETYAGDPGGSEGARLEEQLVVTPTGTSILSLYPFPDYLME